MSPKELTDRLQAALKRRRFKAAIVAATHASELRETIEKKRASGLIDDGVYRQYAAYFGNMLTEDFPWARSIIVLAAPRPLLEVTITFAGKHQAVVIPPTYEHSVDKTAAAIVETVLAPHGNRIRGATLPLKLLAARSGLARYGKNNITYVEGLGSFHRLIAFYSDLPLVNDAWQEPQVLDECSGCHACTKKCPTGAIEPDRFQLRAERCLTYHNESSKPFPEWMQASWHHCLVGCMKCQHYCPVNKDVRSWREQSAEFTDKESELLLRGAATDEMPPSLIAKFENTDLLEDPGGLARNLRSVLAAKG